jgi:hypothetical protein
MDYTDALTYPANRDDWARSVLIGGGLLVLSFLVVPAIVAYGYVVSVIRRSLEGDEEPPTFEDWGDMLVDGLQAWVIGILYLLVPLAVAAITVGGAVIAILTGGDVAASLAGLFGGLALSSLLALVFGYFGVVAIVNFAREGTFGAAFDFGTIFDVATDSRYAVAWLVSVVVLVGVGVITGVLAAIPVVGWIASAFVAFYAQVVAANLWGLGFAEATSGGRDADVGERDEIPV